MAHWDEYLALAQKQRFSHVRLLRYVLEEEFKIRTENDRKLRLARAAIPELFRMETFPFDQQPKLDRKRILSLYDAFDYIIKSQNLIWVGPTGCGKTGLATGFLVQAIQRGYTGRYVLFAELIAELFRSVADHSEPQILKRYLAYDCPSRRRGGLCGSGTRSSRLVLHPDAQAPPEKTHAPYVELG